MSVHRFRVLVVIFSLLLGSWSGVASAAKGMLVITSSPGGAKV